MKSETNTRMFDKESYEKHANWYNNHFPDKADKFNFYISKMQHGSNTTAIWLQECFFNCISPLIHHKNSSWLTVGDAYGFDAQYLMKMGSNAVATDLNTDFLRVARDAGVIIDFAAENAENLSFGDGAFDYLLCKESYHHFPKPYAALYEMIRVSRKAIILMEPHDPIAKMPLLLFFLNLTVSCPFLQRKVWKNRFSFEPVGNFVYKVSEREFEKFAAGLQLPAVAFKYINPNFYHKDNERKEASLTVWPFLVMRLKKFVLDTLMRLKIIPGQVLSAIIFKELPNSEEQKRLKRAGYKIVLIPKNPY